MVSHKRWLIVLVLLVIILANLCTPAAQAQVSQSPFKDISGTYAEKSIVRLNRLGVCHGVAPQVFAPSASISRGDFVVLLAKILGVQPLFTDTPGFLDVVPGTLAAGYAEALARTGIIHGIEKNKLGADIPISRQDAAVILSRLKGGRDVSTNVLGKYRDAAFIAPYAREGVSYVTVHGWMVGSGGRFMPESHLTRAEAAVLADRLLKERENSGIEIAADINGYDLAVDEAKEIGAASYSSCLPFTMVYGSDSPAFSVLSDRQALYGMEEGCGTLTVNAGRSWTKVPVRVKERLSPGIDETTSGSLSGQSNEEGPLSMTEQSLPYTYRIEEEVPDSYFKSMEQERFAGPSEGLASASGEWKGFVRQVSRTIIVDLGAITPVSHVSMEFKQDVASGIYLPAYMKASVSQDGCAWYELGRAVCGPASSGEKIDSLTLTISFPSVSARYLKISFPVDVLVFARHLTVTGGERTEKPVILPLEEDEGYGMGAYLKDSDYRDILLLFTGDKSFAKSFKSQDLLPLVAYVARDGEVKGQMFDTIIFVPYTGMTCSKDSWASYLDDLFTPGQQLDALNQTMLKLKRREKVILTLPYPEAKPTEFGAITADGQSLSWTGGREGLESRKQALLWYYDQIMRSWRKANFTNLDLAGFYWYKESVDSKSGDEELIKEAAALVKSEGKDFFWAPYYGAAGIMNWKDVGFTHAFIQPNYYFTPNPPLSRIDQALLLARKFGMGVEIEFDGRVLTEPVYYDLFYKELKKLHESGLDYDTPSIYYVGFARTLLAAAGSDLPEIRKIYDDLYNFMNGTYR